MKKYLKKLLSGFLICFMLIGILPISVEAGMNSTSYDYNFTSAGNDSYLGENYSFTINNSNRSLIFSGKTRKLYKATMVSIYQIRYNDTGIGSTTLAINPIIVTNSDSFQVTVDISDLREEGATYIIRPNMATEEADTATGYNFSLGRYNMTGALMRYENGRMHFLRYTDVEEQNATIKETAKTVLPENYLDVYMRDSYDADYGLSASAVQALTDFANTLVAQEGAYTDYQKLLVFHDFITQNFYYDSTARNLSSVKATLNPYMLLLNYQSVGKAKTVCDGFAAFFQVLARTQGISCRTASGHNIILPRECWDTEEDADTIDHVWNEAYVDANGDGVKEWITIDCNSDCSNTYTAENGYQSPDYPLFRYTYFNPSGQVLAINHRYINYREKDGNYMKPFITSSQCADGQIVLNWELRYKENGVTRTEKQLNNLAGYILYRRTDKTTWSQIKTFKTSDTAMSYTDTTAKFGVRYYYRLAPIAVSDGSTGYPWLYRTGYAMTTPVIATYNPLGEYTYLSWNRIEGASQYRVYIKIDDPENSEDDNNSFTLVNVVSSKYHSCRAYMDLANSGDNVTIKIIAIKKMNGVTYHSSASETKTVVRLETPSISAVTNNDIDGSVQIDFTGVKGAEKYSIYRSDSPDGTYTRIAQVSAATMLVDEVEIPIYNDSYVDQSVTWGQTYYYKIRALCVRDKKTSLSQFSDLSGITTLLPEDLQTTDDTDEGNGDNGDTPIVAP